MKIKELFDILYTKINFITENYEKINTNLKTQEKKSIESIKFLDKSLKEYLNTHADILSLATFNSYFKTFKNIGENTVSGFIINSLLPLGIFIQNDCLDILNSVATYKETFQQGTSSEVNEKFEELRKAIEENKKNATQAQETATTAQKKAEEMKQELKQAREEIEAQRMQVVLRDEKLQQLTQLMQNIRIIDVGTLPKAIADNITQALQILNVRTSIETKTNIDLNQDQDSSIRIEEISDVAEKPDYFFNYPNPINQNNEFQQWKLGNPALNEQLKIRETVSQIRYVAVCDLIFLRNKSQPSLNVSNSLITPANEKLTKKIDVLVYELLSTKRWNEPWNSSFEQVITPARKAISTDQELKKLYDCLITMQDFPKNYRDELPKVYEEKDCYSTLASVFQNGYFVQKNILLKNEFLNAFEILVRKSNLAL